MLLCPDNLTAARGQLVTSGQEGNPVNHIISIVLLISRLQSYPPSHEKLTSNPLTTLVALVSVQWGSFLVFYFQFQAIHFSEEVSALSVSKIKAKHMLLSHNLKTCIAS